MDPVSIAGLALTCFTIVQWLASLAARGANAYDDYKRVPGRVQRLLRYCDSWGNLIGEIHKLLLQGMAGKLFDKAVRAQLEIYLDDTKNLLTEADGLITDYEDGKLQKVVNFINLEQKFEMERGRLHIWIEVAHL